MQETVRLELHVSPDFDSDLRGFLGQDSQAISSFVEKAVRREMFYRTVQQIKADNAETDPEELQATIDQAVREVRQERTGSPA